MCHERSLMKERASCDDIRIRFMAFLLFDKVQVLLYDGEERFFYRGLIWGMWMRKENRRMKARLKIAYSDEAWSMIGEIEGRKSVRLKDSHIKG